MSADISERERVEVCVLALLAAAETMRLEITRTKMVKLLYLADVQSVEHDRITGSGVAWRWMDYGPYDDVLREVEDDLVKRGLVRRETLPREEGGERNVLTAVDTSITVPDDFSDHILTTVAEKGDWKIEKLMDYAYETKPMAVASQGDTLDFTVMGHLTMADIEESIGKGPAYDPDECTFYASTEDFIEAMRADRGGRPADLAL